MNIYTLDHNQKGPKHFKPYGKSKTFKTFCRGSLFDPGRLLIFDLFSTLDGYLGLYAYSVLQSRDVEILGFSKVQSHDFFLLGIFCSENPIIFGIYRKYPGMLLNKTVKTHSLHRLLCKHVNFFVSCKMMIINSGHFYLSLHIRQVSRTRARMKNTISS